MLSQNTRQWIIFVLVILVLGWFYSIATIFGCFMFHGKPPEWWLSGSEVLVRHLSYRHLQHGFGITLVSIPFAAGIALLVKSRSILAALIISFLFTALPMITSQAAGFADLHVYGKLSILADLAKNLLILPGLTFLLVRLLAKYWKSDKLVTPESADPDHSEV